MSYVRPTYRGTAVPVAMADFTWWVVHIPNVGTTQGRSKYEAVAMGVGLIEAVLDTADFELDLDFKDARYG